MPKVSVMLQPGLQAAARLVEEAVSRKQLLILVGRCRVEYEGRAASKLGAGDRLVIVKPDGAVLVHRPTGYSPVNWQPDSKVLRAMLGNDELVLESVREKPREILRIHFTSLYMAAAIEGLEDKAEFVEYLDEAELRDYLAAHPDLVEEGLQVIRVERPMQGEGYADIVARDQEGRYVVIEVKRVHAGREAVKQLHRYVEALRRSNPEAPVRGILVAPSIASEALQLLRSLGLEYKRIDVRKIFEAARAGKRPAGTRSLLDFIPRGGEG